MASGSIWWTWQNQSQVQTGQWWADRPFPRQLLSTCVLPPYFQFMIQKNSKICYSLTTRLWYKCRGSHCVHSKCVWETATLQKAGRRQCSVTCLWERMLSHSKGDYDRQDKKAAGNRQQQSLVFIRVLRVNDFDMRKGEKPFAPIHFAFPLAIYIHPCDFHNVTNLWGWRKKTKSAFSLQT